MYQGRPARNASPARHADASHAGWRSEAGGRRKPNRFRGYDYSQSGWYFITICVQNRECLFGQIENGRMVLKEAGKIVTECWHDLPNHYPNCRLEEFIVMPNHFHGIVVIVGATPCGRPKNVVVVPRRYIMAQTLRWGTNPNENNQPRGIESVATHRIESGQPHGVAPTLGDVMDWFKTMTANDYIRGVKINKWPPFDKRVWQRNYYDHIIRDEKSYWAIKEYIRNNPAHWTFDEENPSNISVNQIRGAFVG